MEPLGEFSDLLLVTGGPPRLPQLLSGLIPFQPQLCSTTSVALLVFSFQDGLEERVPYSSLKYLYTPLHRAWCFSSTVEAARTAGTTVAARHPSAACHSSWDLGYKNGSRVAEGMGWCGRGSEVSGVGKF